MTVAVQDVVVFSSSVIPGNETRVKGLIKNLTTRGARIVQNGMNDDGVERFTHVSVRCLGVHHLPYFGSQALVVLTQVYIQIQTCRQGVLLRDAACCCVLLCACI